MIKCQRSYKLRIYPNNMKSDGIRYTCTAFQHWFKHWIGKAFFNIGKKPSTTGMGKIANQALHKCWGQIKAAKASARATGNKLNVPRTENFGVAAKLEKSKSSSFNFWVSVQSLWHKGKRIKVPAKSHKALNKALKNGWKISEHCELKKFRGHWEAVVYVSKEVPKAQTTVECIGADVGINKSVSFSDGYKGESLKEPIAKAKESQRERYRQRMKFGQIQRLKFGKKDKSVIKQILDHEAHELIRRSSKLKSNIVVESRRILANLKCGRLNRWARCYFANRLEVLCRECSIFFLEVNPWKSSKVCGHCDKEGSRDKEEFTCLNSNCPEYLVKADADINAAKVLRGRGRGVVEKIFLPMGAPEAESHPVTPNGC